LVRIERADPDEAETDQLLTQPMGSVREHVQEEEGDLFPRLGSAASEQRGLGAARPAG
jgi:hemerythrin superfamily protein